MDWHLRAFVFTAVGCFLTSLLFLTIQITGLIKMFQFNWHFVVSILKDRIGTNYANSGLEIILYTEKGHLNPTALEMFVTKMEEKKSHFERTKASGFSLSLICALKQGCLCS
jgi:hypothetical protein